MRGRWAVLLLCGLALSGCPKKKPAAVVSSKVTIFVSVPPLVYLVDQLRWDGVTVRTLLEEGQAPALEVPTEGRVAAAAQADMVFRVGLPFEDKVVAQIEAKGDTPVVDLRQGVDLLDIPGGGGYDPHIWLDPRNAMVMARTISEALIALDARRERLVKKNLTALMAALKVLDRELEFSLTANKGARLFASHGAFAYLCKRYGLRHSALHWQGQLPGKEAYAPFIQQVVAQGNRVLFIQRSMTSETLQTAARGAGVTLVAMDPLARDIPGSLRQMVASMREMLVPPAPDGPAGMPPMPGGPPPMPGGPPPLPGGPPP